MDKIKEFLNKKIVIKAFVCLCMITVAFSGIKIFIYLTDLKNNQTIQREVQEAFYQAKIDKTVNHEVGDHKQKDTPDNTPQERKISEHFFELLEKNDDTKGWLRIGETVIDYPVVQSNDNSFYLDKNFDKEKNTAGSIFLDYRNSINKFDQNTIIYGHSMKDGSMFAELLKYKNKDFFENNPIITFETLYEVTEWEVFAVYTSDIDFNYIKTNFDTKNEFNNFLNIIHEKSIYESIDDLNPDDRILTLSTCDYVFDDARLVVQARQLNNDDS